MTLLRMLRPSRSESSIAGLILALWLAAPASASGDECRGAPNKEPEVTFTLQTGSTTWHYDKTREQIRALRANSGAKVAAVGPNWQSIGLTLATFVLAVDVRVAAVPIRSPKAGSAAPEYCARLIAADVKFGTSRMDAYVTRDYRRGSCPHRVVRDHEGRHVAIYRAAVERFAPRMEQRLRAAVRELPLVRVASAKAGAERLRKMLHDDLSRIFDAMGRDMEVDNRALDTPAAYADERKLCPRGEW
jgi:hypothetical protein